MFLRVPQWNVFSLTIETHPPRTFMPKEAFSYGYGVSLEFLKRVPLCQKAYTDRFAAVLVGN
jgi:hypothetical protein